MSTDTPEPRELARWATPTRAERPRLMRGLVSEVRKLLVGARWSGPADVAPRASRDPAPEPLGCPTRRVAVVPPWIHLDGPPLARLPAGPVIFVANHPTATTADLVLARLDPARRARTVIISVPSERHSLVSRLFRRRLRMDFDKPGTARDRLLTLLGEGWSVLIFPEGPPAAGATKRPFHGFAALLSDATGLPVVPVGIRGARAVRATPGSSRVSIRFGHPLHVGADARDQEAAINGLIAEDGATWWEVQRAEPGNLPGTKTPETAHTWRHVWAQTARPRKGGVPETPRIWRTTR